MFFLLSGEGTGDIGICNPSAEACEGQDFNQGPMAIMIDQLIELFQGYEMSHLETGRIGYVSKAYLVNNKLPPVKKSMSLKGKKKPAETKYYFENARALANAAKTKSTEIDDKVVAILFRDADGTASANRGNWDNKRQSMIEGFKAEYFEYGVAMVPKPKSEAWLLCATKDNPYQHCSVLEDEPGNDDSHRPSLKDKLSNVLNGKSDKNSLNQLVIDRIIDIEKIDMHSFNIFKNDLKKAIDLD